MVDAPLNEKCLLDATLKDIRLVLQAYPMSAMLKQLMFWHTGSPLSLLPPLTRLPASVRIKLSKKLSEMPFFKEAFPLALCG